jgi:hypothetical protein
MTSKNRHLRLLQWNANGLTGTKLEEFKNGISVINPHVKGEQIVPGAAQASW